MAENARALYVAHLLGLLVPLLTLPYLARVLRPGGLGLVVFAQSFGAWVALVLEYGFDLFGTRAVARGRGEPARIPELVAGVQGARGLVSLPVLAGMAALFALLPQFREQPALALWAGCYALFRGFHPAWYFLGQERMRWPAFIEVGGKGVAAAGVFLLVRAPGDEWKVLALQALGAGIATTWLTAWMYREIPFRLPGVARAVGTLRAATGVFLFRGASGLYLQANGFVLGLLATPQVVAYFGGAERLIRAAVNLFHPLSQALFPRLSHLLDREPARAGRLLGIGLLLMVGGGVIMGLVAVLGAPLLVTVLLGPGYEASVPVLRFLSILLPLIAVGTIFGVQWALPAGLERPFFLLVLTAGILNVGLAVLLVPRQGAMGMAASLVAAELLVTAGLLLLFRAKGGRFRPLRLPPRRRE